MKQFLRDLFIALCPGLAVRWAETKARMAAQKLQEDVVRLKLQRSKIRLIKPVDGLYPAIETKEDTSVLDLNRGVVFSTQRGVQRLSEHLLLPEQERRWLEAHPLKAGQALPALAPGRFWPWPDRLDIRSVFRNRQATLNSLVLGGLADGSLLTRSLAQMMHTLIVGITGSGKSSVLWSLLWQIAHAQEQVNIIGIDTSGARLNPLTRWGKLLYPIARTHTEALALIQAGLVELERRKELYQGQPRAMSLPAYNSLVGADQQLSPWLFVIDEGPTLMNDQDNREALRQLAERGRQYGMWCTLTGTNILADTFSTPMRDQFYSRICLAATADTQRIALGKAMEETDDRPGRGYARLRGELNPRPVQTLFVDEDWDGFYEPFENGGPKNPMPDLDAMPVVDAEYTVKEKPRKKTRGMTMAQQVHVLTLYFRGLNDPNFRASDTHIAETVFGYSNNSTLRKVRAIIAQAQRFIESDDVA